MIISIIDIRQRRIPDFLLVIASFVSIILALLFDRPNLPYRFLLSGAIFLLMYLFYRIMKNGLGFGDVKFISLAAFNLGIFDAWIMLVVACALGIVYALTRKAMKKGGPDAHRKIPFAPFLCLGILVSLFANPPLL